MDVPTPPKVHRHHRHRRSNRRGAETSSSTERQSQPNESTASPSHHSASFQHNQPHHYPLSPLARVHERTQQQHNNGNTNSNTNSTSSASHHNIQVVASFHQSNAAAAAAARPTQNQENPAVLVNGHEPHLDEHHHNHDEADNDDDDDNETTETKPNDSSQSGVAVLQSNSEIRTSSTSQPSPGHAIPIVKTKKESRKSGENREASTRNQSDILTTTRIQQQLDAGGGMSLGGSRRNISQLTPHGSPRPGSAASNADPTALNPQNAHKDPQASPAQRSTRSRSSLEKSPRRKRSKSESRRRRERKLIAAGEMEVRQANETLMRYLKQVSEMNDASLSGELEIDHNFDERRVHRKTKSQRDKRGQIISKSSVSKLYAAGGGLSSILRDLSEDIVPGSEIYNPFTPVVSPTEGPPSRIDKMFIQTSSGYRAVDYYKHQDPESNKHEINTSVNLSCALQRVWIMVSNICHGLLGGLALAHLLFIVTNRPFDWVDGAIKHYSAFAEVYANTFFCLAILCMVSIFDRMDICHIDLTNASELVSFRWIIIAMIYIATIILTLCAETIDERLYLSNLNVTVLEEEMENNQVLNVWNSLSIARSIGAIFGWIMIGFSPGEDLLYENLLEMEKYQLTNN